MSTDASGEKELDEASLLFLVDGDYIALGVKRLKIGAGCYMGPGGGIELGEDEFISGIRETWEEWKIAVDPKSVAKVAVMDFHNTKTDGNQFTCRVHILFAYTWKGIGVGTTEMGPPVWFKKDYLPLGIMMPADRIWLPPVLAGKTIVGEAWYGPKQQTLIGQGVVYKEVSPVEVLRLRPWA